MQRPLLLLISIVIMPLFSACALFTPEPRFTADSAKEQLMHINRLNDGVSTFKGTGSVVITEKGRSQRFRIAWVGASPDLLRMEILTSATPLESLAYDGTYLQLISHVDNHSPFTKKMKNPSLESATDIPMTLTEIHALLSGKFAVGPFKTARMLTQDEGPSTLVLRPDRNRKKTITLDKELLPSRVMITEGNELVYDLRLARKTTPAGFNQYGAIDLTSGSGNTIAIRIERMVVNPPIEDGTFTLHP